jgi:hypothetical protein
MKIVKTDQVTVLKIRFWYDKCIAFLSFVVFAALASGVIYWSAHLLKPIVIGKADPAGQNSEKVGGGR